MPNFTTSLGLLLPNTGEFPNTWGTEVNTGITNLTDSAIAGYTSITMVAADYTLTSGNGVANEARSMLLNIAGAPGAARNVICPARSKLYFVRNVTTGGFAVTLKTPSGSGISIPNGRSMVLMCDGTNVREAVDFSTTANATNISYTGTLTGGTGVVNLGSGQFYKDASGNLGVGTTSPGFKLDVNGTIRSTGSATIEQLATINATSGVTSTLRLAQSGIVNWDFKNTATTGILDITNGAGSALKSESLNSGVVGAYITSAGNVGMGTTAPGAPLDVVTNSAAAGFSLRGRTSDNVSDISLKSNSAATVYGQLQGRSTDLRLQAGGALPLTFYTNATEAARIDSSGNVGIGGAPNNRFDVYGSQDSPVVARVSNASLGASATARITLDTQGGSWYIDNTRTNGAFVVGNGANERMRIDSSGNVGIGTTALAGSRLSVQQPGAASVPVITSNHTAASGTRYHIVFSESGTERGSVTSNGSVVAYNTSSDVRLKTNIAPAADAGALLDAVQVRQFDWLSDDSHQRYGFIAQELVEVVPEAVHAPADPDDMMAVDYSKLVPLLVREIQSLRARVAALEA